MAVEPTTYGFPYASIDAAALPEWIKNARARFSVAGVNDWKVSSLGSLDRGIRVEVGTGHGDGVTVKTHEYETMSLPYPDIATRWYLIARRRNWAGTGTATLVALPAGATPSLPAVGNAATQMKNKPGVESDQPLALVRVTQKDRTVQEVIPLHAWAGPGGVEVAHRLALSYLAEPGASVKLGTSTWRYELQANNVWDWREYPVPAEVAPLVRSGYRVVRTNPDGFCTVPYEKPFPGGTTVAVPVSMNPPAGMSLIRFISGEKAAANFLVTATSGAPLKNVSVAIGYIATGF